MHLKNKIIAYTVKELIQKTGAKSKLLRCVYNNTLGAYQWEWVEIRKDQKDD